MESMIDVPTRKERKVMDRRAETRDFPLPRSSDRGQGIRDYFNDALGPPRPERAQRWPRFKRRFKRPPENPVP
jgi:hypothetical protein